jgi:predicted nucleotidyltransferase
MVDQAIIDVIRDYLQALEAKGLPVSHAVLFGSHAKGKVHEWSDIDVIIVSKRFDTDFSYDDVDLLWHTTLDIDSRIEPIPCGEQRWLEDNFSPILDIARREGIIITPEPELT